MKKTGVLWLVLIVIIILIILISGFSIYLNWFDEGVAEGDEQSKVEEEGYVEEGFVSAPADDDPFG